MATRNETRESAPPLRFLIGLDVFLAKAVSDHPLAPALALERRLARTLRREFERRAAQALAAVQDRLDDEPPTAPVTAEALTEANGAAERAFTGIADAVGETLQEVIRAAYAEDRKRILLRATYRKTGKRLLQKDVGVLPAFDLVDDQAVEALTRHQAYWIGASYSNVLSGRIAEVSRVMVEEGISAREAGTKLEQVLRAEFGLDGTVPHGAAAMASVVGAPVQIPGGWRGTSIQYMDALAANTVTVGRGIGAMRGLRESGATLFEIVSSGASNVCEMCSWMDGKTFTTDDGAGLADQLVQTQSPEDVRAIQPWMHLGAFLKASGLSRSDKGPVDAAKTKTLVGYGKQLPPFHLKCHCTVDIAQDARFEPDTAVDVAAPPVPTSVPASPTPPATVPRTTRLTRELARAEAEIRSLKFERLYAFDSKGKQTLVKSGNQYGIGFTDAEAVRLRDTHATHNHPTTGGSFSLEDIMTAITRNVKEMRAVGAVYKYRMMRPKKGWPRAVDVHYGFHTHDRVVYSDHLRAIKQKKITRAEAELIHNHKVWTRVAKDFRIRYKRERW